MPQRNTTGSGRVYLSKDAHVVLERIRQELVKRRPEGAEDPSFSDAVLELARRANRY